MRVVIVIHTETEAFKREFANELQSVGSKAIALAIKHGSNEIIAGISEKLFDRDGYHVGGVSIEKEY
jgi:hypothetical protein